jgi:ATP-binding cassette, subfamily C, bacterial
MKTERMKDPLSTRKLVTRLLKLAGPFKGILTLSIAAGYGGSLAAIGLFAASAGAAAAVLNGSPILPYGAVAVLCGLLRGSLRLGEHYWGHDAAFRLLAQLRVSLFTRLQDIAPAGVIDSRNGEMLSAVVSDIEQIEVFFAHSIAPVIVGFGVSVTVLIHLFLLQPVFALILLPWHILLGVIIPLVSTALMKKTGTSYRNRLSSVHSSLLENLQNLKTLMMLRKDTVRLNETLERADEAEHSRRRLLIHEGFTTAAGDAAVFLAVLSMITAAAAGIRGGKIEPGTAAYLTVLTLTSMGPLIQLSLLSNSLASTFSSARRVFSILDQEPAAVDTPYASSVPRITGSPELRNVTFSYPKKTIPVLQAKNIRFQEGRMTSIGGKSGRGKSTILYLIMRFWDPNSGQVRIGERSVQHLYLRDIHRNISYITQDTFIFNTTVYENILIARQDASEDEVFKAAGHAAIHDEIMQFPDGYRTKVGEHGARLSAGQRQRVGLARAFLQNSDILLFDEPTSNLDERNQRQILKSIGDTCMGKTVLIVSHQESTRDYSDFHIEL